MRAGDVLALQRTIGNRATTRLLQPGARSDPTPRLQRQSVGLGPNPANDPRLYSKGAPAAKKCAPPPGCPPGFCDPYESEGYAKSQRARLTPFLLLGIRAAVDSRVVPLWRDYLGGGSPPRDLTATFGSDFAKSPTTAKTTTFLVDALRRKLQASRPTIPIPLLQTQLPLSSLIATEIAEINDPSSLNQMNFDLPGDIPGNLAGGIGTNQTSCRSGAQPSPFNDERHAEGVVTVSEVPWGFGTLLVSPVINYTVRDTIDLCPGNCGTEFEQFATVALSQFEATGISGDVPFTVKFTVTPPPFFV